MRRIVQIIAAILGIGLILFAVLAYRLGIDHNPDWGMSRVLMAAAGATLLLSSILSWQWKTLEPTRRRLRESIAHAQSAGGAWWEHQPANHRLKRWIRVVVGLPGIRWLAAQPERQAALAFWVGLLGLCLIYVWYMTAGTLIHWFPYYHDYYDRLAQAFLHGQLALLEKPDPALLALANPYVYDNRAGIAYPWDVSLFQGKFYLYWGPVPGLIAAAARWLAQARIEDQMLVLAAQLGVGAMLAANLAAMRRRFAPGSNPFGLMMLILAGGANLYLLWPNGRPGVYEAAILSGQFFLLAGILAVFLALKQPEIKRLPAVLAGVCWLLAVGSRASLAVTVGWLAGCVLVYMWWVKGRAGRQVYGTGAAFLLPLVVGGAVLMGYNYLRFGSVLETGISYQLSIPQYPPQNSWLFSLVYIIPNVYGYIFRAPLVESHFPFISAPYIQERAWPWFVRLPEHYIYHEPQLGLLMILPLAGFALVPFYYLARGLLTNRGLTVKLAAGEAKVFETFWTILLCGAVLIQAGVILFYFFSALRFQIEIAPLVFLLACLGIWRIDRSLAAHPAWRWFLWCLVILLALYSLIVGLFGAFSAGEQRFEANNPHLFAALRAWFSAHFSLILYHANCMNVKLTSPLWVCRCLFRHFINHRPAGG